MIKNRTNPIEPASEAMSLPMNDDQIIAVVYAAYALRTIFKEPLTIDNILERLEDHDEFEAIDDAFEMMSEKKKLRFINRIKRIMKQKLISIGDWYRDDFSDEITRYSNLEEVTFSYFEPVAS